MKRWLCVLVWLAVMAPAGANPDARVHQALDWLVGTWDTREVKQRAGKSPARAVGVATFNWDMQGRYLHESYSSEGDDGHFEGQGFMDWDSASGRYRLWWFDCTGGAQAYDSAWDGKSPRVLYTVSSDQGQPVLTRETYTRISETEYTYRMDIDSGKGYQVQWELSAVKRQ